VPEVLHGRLDGLFHALLGRRVTLAEERAVRTEFAHHLLAAVGVTAADHHPRSLGEKALRDRAADAPGATGDHRDLAVQLHRQLLSSSVRR